MTKRCAWVTDDPVSIRYHDEEWGDISRVKDDRYMFEMISLEGAQAGLSWITILKRREAYREAFAHFDPYIIQTYTDEDVDRLMKNDGIIRNRRKIKSVIQNAKAYVSLVKTYDSFYDFLQTIIPEELPIYHQFTSKAEIPNQTDQSIALSKALKKQGFSFVGPVICYAFMQAVGIVNDHTADCYLYKEEA